MKKIITIALFFLPLFGFTQTVNKVDTLVTKAKVVVAKTVPVSTIEQELDEEYTERPFKGKEEVLKVTPYTGLTDHEEYNLRLKQKGQPKLK